MKRSNVVFLAIAIVVAIGAVVFYMNYPPVDQRNAQGSIGAVEKYRSNQIGTTGVVLVDEKTRKQEGVIYGDFLEQAAQLQINANTLNLFASSLSAKDADIGVRMAGVKADIENRDAALYQKAIALTSSLALRPDMQGYKSELGIINAALHQKQIDMKAYESMNAAYGIVASALGVNALGVKQVAAKHEFEARDVAEAKADLGIVASTLNAKNGLDAKQIENADRELGIVAASLGKSGGLEVKMLECQLQQLGSQLLEMQTLYRVRETLGQIERNFAAKSDLSAKGDLAVKGDLAQKADLGAKADVGVKGDLAQKADLGAKADVGVKGDLAQKADLGAKADVGVKGDLAQKADLGVRGDVAQKADLGAKGDLGLNASLLNLSASLAMQASTLQQQALLNMSDRLEARMNESKLLAEMRETLDSINASLKARPDLGSMNLLNLNASLAAADKAIGIRASEVGQAFRMEAQAELGIINSYVGSVANLGISKGLESANKLEASMTLQNQNLGVKQAGNTASLDAFAPFLRNLDQALALQPSLSAKDRAEFGTQADALMAKIPQ